MGIGYKRIYEGMIVAFMVGNYNEQWPCGSRILVWEELCSFGIVIESLALHFSFNLLVCVAAVFSLRPQHYLCILCPRH